MKNVMKKNCMHSDILAGLNPRLHQEDVVKTLFISDNVIKVKCLEAKCRVDMIAYNNVCIKSFMTYFVLKSLLPTCSITLQIDNKVLKTCYSDSSMCTLFLMGRFMQMSTSLAHPIYLDQVIGVSRNLFTIICK